MKPYHLYGKEPFYTNCYLITDNKGNRVMIDCSAEISKVKKILENDRAQMKAIFLTHGHRDHTETLAEAREEFDCPVYLGEEDARLFGYTDTIPFVDEAKFEVGEMNFTVIATPGHTPGGYCILCEDMLFSGDTLFAGTVGRTDLEGGDMDTLMKSLKKLVRVVTDDNVKVLPGHNHFSRMGIEKSTNPFLTGKWENEDDE